MDVIREIEQHANDYAVVIGNFSQNEEREKLYMAILRPEWVDGFIVAPFYGMEAYVEELVQDGFAVVCIDRGLTKPDVDVVKVQDIQPLPMSTVDICLFRNGYH